MFYGVPYYLQFNGQEIIVMDIVHYNYNTHRIQVSEKLSCEQGMCMLSSVYIQFTCCNCGVYIEYAGSARFQISVFKIITEILVKIMHVFMLGGNK